MYHSTLGVGVITKKKTVTKCASARWRSVLIRSPLSKRAHTRKARFWPCLSRESPQNVVPSCSLLALFPLRSEAGGHQVCVSTLEKGLDPFSLVVPVFRRVHNLFDRKAALQSRDVVKLFRDCVKRSGEGLCKAVY